MTLQEIKDLKRELGLTNEHLAGLSGVPLSTVQKVLGGVTGSPRKKTLDALSRALAKEKTASSGKGAYGAGSLPPGFFRDGAPAYRADPNRVYTIEDIYALPDGVRAELMDGKLYYMATPTRTHQKIVGEMHLEVANYIRAHGGKCEVYIPPFAVFLFGDDSTYVEPDLSVICDPSKLNERGCIGAPDWVVEVLSPSSTRMDCMKKLVKYSQAGVREYWIIYPDKRMVTVCLFSENEEEESVSIYSFEDEIPCSLYQDLLIRLGDVL